MTQSDQHGDRGHADVPAVAVVTTGLATPDDPGTRAADRTADLYASFEHDRRKERFERAVLKGRQS